MTGSADRLVVLEAGRELSFTFEDMLSYHAGGSPGGVAHAFKVMQRALPALEADGRIERREILIRTAFGGPGARDGFELVTRAVSEDRFTVDPALARPQYGIARERFVFCLGYRSRAATLTLRHGFVSEHFIELARQEDRSADEERELSALKTEMATRVMGAPASRVYDVEAGT